MLANPEYRGKSNTEIARLAGITPDYFWRLRQNPAFIEAVKIHCGGLCIQSAPAIVHAFAEKGKEGQYQQGKLILEMAGMYQEQPLIQQVLLSLKKEGMSEEEVDNKLSKYFTQPIDVE